MNPVKYAWCRVFQACLRLVAENLENAYRDGNDMEARANMLRAAFLAGGAFSKSYVGYCHAVAHSLGGKYHTPHGLANAVLLPFVLERYGSAIHRKGRDIAVAMHLAQPEDIPGLAVLADKEANPLYPVPVLMTAKELERFYYDVME